MISCRGVARLLVVALVLLTGCRTADHWYRRGQNAEKPKLKVKYFTHALDLDPGRMDALRERGAALLLVERNAEALEDLNQALKSDPDHALTLNNRAVANMRLGHEEQAREDLERALKSSPKLADAHDNLGRLDERASKYEDALKSYARAIECDPTYALAHLNRGRLRFRLGDVKNARRDYERAIQEGNDYIRTLAYSDLTLTYVAEREIQRAFDTLREFQQRLPNAADWMYMLGALFYIQARYRTAGACFEQTTVMRYQKLRNCFLYLVLTHERVFQTPHKAQMQLILDNEAIEGWPLPLMRAYTGQLPLDEAFEAAGSDLEQAEAGYFLGELALLENKPEEARRYFAKAANIKNPASPEKHLAALRLLMKR